MRPDLIINPSAFPSRMTIGMLIESIAAKGGSLHGQFVDATPFSSSFREQGLEKSSEESSLIDEIGSILMSHGFNKHGLEVLYSGVCGEEFECEIFIGPVYYQRLRHMVGSTGTMDQITRLPIGGRKRGGGIRFGEMERDSILAHGVAYLLHNRLHSWSDYQIADVCSNCGGLISTIMIEPRKRMILKDIKINLPLPGLANNVKCRSCESVRQWRLLQCLMSSDTLRLNWPQ